MKATETIIYSFQVERPYLVNLSRANDQYKNKNKNF